MILCIHRSKLLHHGLLHQLTNSPCLFLVHGCLICQTNLVQHGIRIKPFGNSLLEILQESLLIPTIDDIIRHHLGLLVILHTNIILAERRRSNGLLMPILPMNHRSQPLPLMLIHRIPNLAYPRTRRIHHLHILLVHQRHLLEGRSKRRKNHHVSIFHLRKILLSLSQLLDELHVHLMQIIVHFGVVNQFVGDVDGSSREVLHGLVRQGDAAFDAPAESKVFGQVDADAVSFDDVIAGFQFVDEGGFELGFHGFFDVGADVFEAFAVEVGVFHVLEAFFFFGWFLFGCGGCFLGDLGGLGEGEGGAVGVVGGSERLGSCGASGDDGGDGHDGGCREFHGFVL
mmetsp:Transcript_19622/g.40725  ORF Transcript_19622/g.40725 Transcript_19622/m.40725 type:complete len:342 (-) Transcript_19622:182-1207(-)